MPHKHDDRWHKVLTRIWVNLNHAKVAKWTLIVHIVYYVHATTHSSGMAWVTSAACAVALLIELFSKER